MQSKDLKTHQFSDDYLKNWRKSRRLSNFEKGSLSSVPKPFLKWAGGKRQLLSQFKQYFPNSFDNFIEPFLGGGAIFFFLLPENAILSDLNEELINTYKVIQENIDELIDLLKKHKNEKNYYYSIRNVDRLPEFKSWSNVERASRTIYLNRSCFNGLYRVNSKGFFNVPFGKYKNPNYCDEVNLRAVHLALQGIKLKVAHFEECLNWAKENDFVYFDPPYIPVSKTASFTGYTKNMFGPEDQEKLRDIIKKLDRKKVKIMLSNSDVPEIVDLYDGMGFNIYKVSAKRAINSVGSKRGPISEVVITNY